MDHAIMNHFHETHNSTPGVRRCTGFPKLPDDLLTIRRMAKNVSRGKAIVFDGIDDSLFAFAKNC